MALLVAILNKAAMFVAILNKAATLDAILSTAAITVCNAERCKAKFSCFR